jgi:large subunit ribosomal protein L9
MDIADALKAKGYEMDRRKIVLRDPIKETGEYTVNVKLHREVTLQVPVKVTAEGGEVAEEKTEKKSRKAKGEAEEAPAEAAAAPEATAEAQGEAAEA